MSLTFDQQNAIDAYVTAYNQPAVHSLDAETHIFHFARDTEWWESPLLFVNRNGNHFTMFDNSGTWEHLKTWVNPGKAPHWATSNLRREDPVQLIQLCNSGPQGRQHFEALCYFPKEVTRAGRMVSWRQNLLQVHHDRENDAFTLVAHSPGDVLKSPQFKGKLWESRQAATWCSAELPRLPSDYAAPLSSLPQDSSVFQKARELQEAAIVADLEDNPLYGAFG